MTNNNMKLEQHNFKINSDGWKKIIVDDEKYLENPKKDIWEILDRECRGEQLFTWDAAMRETKKRGKHIPTDKEFDELLKVKEDIPNLVFPGDRSSNGNFRYRGSDADFWPSSGSGGIAWSRNLNSRDSTVHRITYLKTYGFSVRCLKNNDNYIKHNDISAWMNYGKARGFDKYLIEQHHKELLKKANEYNIR